MLVCGSIVKKEGFLSSLRSSESLDAAEFTGMTATADFQGVEWVQLVGHFVMEGGDVMCACVCHLRWPGDSWRHRFSCSKHRAAALVGIAAEVPAVVVCRVGIRCAQNDASTKAADRVRCLGFYMYDVFEVVLN
jgi:hypothetical protein